MMQFYTSYVRGIKKKARPPFCLIYCVGLDSL